MDRAPSYNLVIFKWVGEGVRPDFSFLTFPQLIFRDLKF
jgi:hypothetical protein